MSTDKLEFSGKPETYFKIAVFGSIALNLSLFLGLAAVEYFFQGETWLFHWKPIALTVVFSAVLARVGYRWIMRLDAQFGSGKGWQMPSHAVKLPEPVSRPK